MSYTPTTWTTGDTITASAMNKIENGIANAGGGIDGIITIYHGPSSVYDYEPAIESGTFSALASKLNDGITPAILVKVFDDMLGTIGSCFATIYGYDLNASSPFITLNAYIITAIDGSQLLGDSFSYINWNAEDEVTM